MLAEGSRDIGEGHIDLSKRDKVETGQPSLLKSRQTKRSGLQPLRHASLEPFGGILDLLNGLRICRTQESELHSFQFCRGFRLILCKINLVEAIEGTLV